MSVSILNVLTFNVWGLPWPAALHRQRRFRGILASLSQRSDHLVGVQELWAGARLPFAGLRTGPRTRDSGLALGGRVALPEPTLSHFRRSRGTDALKAKGVLRAEIAQSEFGPLRVLVTHLQAGAKHAAVRAHQVDQLLETASGDAMPTVLMGDFNFHDRQADDAASAARLAAAGFVDAAVEAGTPEPTWDPENRYVRGRRAQRFDRILLRSTARTELVATTTAVLIHDEPLSDHHPLWARVRVRRRGPDEG